VQEGAVQGALSSSLLMDLGKFGTNHIKFSCSFLLLFCLDITSLLYNSFLLQVLIILTSSANVDPVTVQSEEAQSGGFLQPCANVGGSVHRTEDAVVRIPLSKELILTLAEGGGVLLRLEVGSSREGADAAVWPQSYAAAVKRRSAIEDNLK